MADKHSIIITSTTPSGKTNQKAIPYVNPQASSAAMKRFATAINATTDNTISAIERVDRVDITDAKFDPQLTVTPDTAVLDSTKLTFEVSYLGDGTITLTGKKPINGAGGLTYNANTKQIVNNSNSGIVVQGGETYTTTVELSETDDYAAATATITWTNAEEEQFEDI
ncbi:MAG: hypothetical protein IJ774_08850 [Selenomonadaceae bacterium]|nr:hypothetical protein [Selenomonadaceae bacterium]